MVKHSCRLAGVVLEQPSKPLTATKATLSHLRLAGRGEQEDVVLALMIALVMIMLPILVERMPERRFAKQDKPRQTLLLDGADGRVPGRCGYCFETSPVPSASYASAGHKLSKLVRNPSSAPVDLHRSTRRLSTPRSSIGILF